MGVFGRARLAVAVAIAAGGLVAMPAGAAGCPTHTVLQDLWTKIPEPAFGGTAQLTTYDAADHALGPLVASDGRIVTASRDAGCTWVTSLLDDDSALDALAVQETKVVRAAISQVRFALQSSTVVWAIGHREVVGATDLPSTQPRVLYSRDGGVTFAPRVTGLPAVGRPVAIRGLGGTAAALVFKTAAPASYSVWTTKDAGATWEQEWGDLPPLADLTVDPFLGEVWTWGSEGVFHEVPGRAVAPRQAVDVVGKPQVVDIAPDEYGRHVVTVFISSGAERFVSYDGGRTFGTTPAPDSVQSVTSHPAFPGLRAISAIETNVLVEPPAPYLGPLDYSPREENVSEIQFVGVRDPRGFPLFAKGPRSLYLRYVPPDFALPPPPPPPPPVDVDLRPPRPPRPVPRITPDDHVVSLRPGEVRTVDYRVALPPVPTPLDVYFMTDSTGSMDNAIASVQEGVQDIVDALAATGVDLNFGVADFRDYEETSSVAGGGGNFAYRQHREIGPIDTDLEDAIEGLSAGGGTVDGKDSALEAIYQGATGAGRRDLRGDVLIPAGQDAEFRDDAMKVILVATDTEMRHPDPANASYPGPSLAVVREALVERGVYLVGIQVDSGSTANSRAELRDLASATGALSPPQGVDCDGDGGIDVVPGDPLVCDFDEDGGAAIADAFVGMLSGIKDLADVDLEVSGPRSFVKPKGYVRVKGETHFPDVNVKAASAYTLPVQFRCHRKIFGTEVPVRISAHSRGETIVSTTTTMRCNAPPVPPEERPDVIPPAVIVALVPPPPPPPAPPNNPLPNPNPNLNPNPQLNPQGGLAAQEDQQFQLALAQDDGVVPDEDLAMSGLDRSGPPLPAMAWATAFAMTGAAAFGMHRIRRTAPAPAFDPREYR